MDAFFVILLPDKIRKEVALYGKRQISRVADT